MIKLLVFFVLISIWLIQRYFHEQTHKEFTEYREQSKQENKALKDELDVVKDELDKALEKLKDIKEELTNESR